MTKKEYIFKFLDKVKGHRDKEPIIRDYLSKNDDVEYTEYLYQELTKIVDSILKTKGEKKISGIVSHLDGIREQEKESQEADTQDLLRLEELINHL